MTKIVYVTQSYKEWLKYQLDVYKPYVYDDGTISGYGNHITELPPKRTIPINYLQDEHGWTPSMFLLMMGHRAFYNFDKYGRQILSTFAANEYSSIKFPDYMQHNSNIRDDGDRTIAMIAFLRNKKIEEWMYHDPTIKGKIFTDNTKLYEMGRSGEFMTLIDMAVKLDRKIPEHFITEIETPAQAVWLYKNYERKSNIFKNNGWECMKIVIQKNYDIKKYTEILKYDVNYIDSNNKRLLDYYIETHKDWNENYTYDLFIYDLNFDPKFINRIFYNQSYRLGRNLRENILKNDIPIDILIYKYQNEKFIFRFEIYIFMGDIRFLKIIRQLLEKNIYVCSLITFLKYYNNSDIVKWFIE